MCVRDVVYNEETTKSQRRRDNTMGYQKANTMTKTKITKNQILPNHLLTFTCLRFSIMSISMLEGCLFLHNGKNTEQDENKTTTC